MLKIIRGRRPFCSNYPTHQFLLTRSKTVLTEVHNVMYGLKIPWCGRSYAASIPFDIQKPQRRQKRIPKVERQAMVESFVNKYRATHDGKFPSVTDAQKNVGGSYYVIRTIVQGLKYQSKMSPSDRGTENLFGEGKIKETKVTMDVEVQNRLDLVAANDLEIGDTCDKHLEAEGGLLPSSVAERTLFEEAEKPTALSDLFATPSDLLGKPEDEKMEEAQRNHLDVVATESSPRKEKVEESHQCNEKPEDGKNEEAEGVPSYFVAKECHRVKEEPEKVCHPSSEIDEQIVSEGLQDSGGTKNEAEQYKGSPKLENNTSESCSRQTNDSKKSTLWRNLKSFADGFMNMWRKQ